MVKEWSIRRRSRRQSTPMVTPGHLRGFIRFADRGWMHRPSDLFEQTDTSYSPSSKQSVLMVLSLGRRRQLSH